MNRAQVAITPHHLQAICFFYLGIQCYWIQSSKLIFFALFLHFESFTVRYDYTLFKQLHLQASCLSTSESISLNQSKGQGFGKVDHRSLGPFFFGCSLSQRYKNKKTKITKRTRLYRTCFIIYRTVGKINFKLQKKHSYRNAWLEITWFHWTVQRKNLNTQT